MTQNARFRLAVVIQGILNIHQQTLSVTILLGVPLSGKIQEYKSETAIIRLRTRVIY